MLSGCTAAQPKAAPAPASRSSADFAGLEQRYAARLGVWAVDTGNGHTVEYRADERFAHCSTFKALLVGALLRRMSEADLTRVVTYEREDLLEYAPITAQHLANGMTVGDLMAAAIQYSDNTAANLLLDELGGPAELQSAVRDLGDSTSTFVRNEPTLNEAVPGDQRDTSVPKDLGADLRALVLSDALSAARRDLLAGWLRGNTTGNAQIRAGVPAGWTVGDKTGSGGHGTRNDIAVIWPAKGAPIVLAVESDRANATPASDDTLIADATRMAIAQLGRSS
jgi:beta-lactamase class A